jgi:hypothetical protein
MAGQFGVRTAVVARDFLFSIQVQSGCAAHPAYYTIQWVAATLPRVSRPRRGVDEPHSSSAKFKSNTSTAPSVSVRYITGSPLQCNSYSKNPNKMQQFIKILLFLILNEDQHVSGDTPPIVRSLKPHK